MRVAGLRSRRRQEQVADLHLNFLCLSPCFFDGQTLTHAGTLVPCASQPGIPQQFLTPLDEWQQFKSRRAIQDLLGADRELTDWDTPM
jgi:hypothetical protein